MKVLITLLLSIFCSSIVAQTFSYPSVNKIGKIIKDFIPPNWFLKDSCVGDLNGDNNDDIAFVIECRDTIKELRPDSSIVKASPRVLLIACKNIGSGTYNLVLQNNTFIIRYGEGEMDPTTFGKLSIYRNILKIEFYFVRGYSIYKFRFDKNDFYLIGAVSHSVAGRQFTGVEVNFLTKKAKITTGDVAGEHQKIKFSKILPQSLIRLKEFKMLFTVEVLPQVYL